MNTDSHKAPSKLVRIKTVVKLTGYSRRAYNLYQAALLSRGLKVKSRLGLSEEFNRALPACKDTYYIYIFILKVLQFTISVCKLMIYSLFKCHEGCNTHANLLSTLQFGYFFAEHTTK